MTQVAPKVIRRKDPSKLEIEWADDAVSSFTPATLRRICPCAHCVSELTGERLLDPATVADDLRQTDVRLVGNYAIAIQFSDGHNTGIYPFTFLREQG